MNEKLSIQDLIDLLARKHQMPRKESETFVKEFFQLIEEALETDKYVKVKGLGTFKLISVDSRESVKVNTGERFQIEGHTKVSFTPEPSLRDIINRPFSHFETVVLNEGTVFEDMPQEKEEEEEEAPIAIEEAPILAVETPKIEVETPEEVAEKVEEPLETAEEPLEETKEPLKAPEASVPEATPSKKGNGMKYFTGLLLFVMLLCIGVVSFLYLPDLFKNDTPAPVAKVTPVIESKQPKRPAVVATDTMTTPAQTIAEAPKPVVEPAKPTAEAPKPVAEAGKPAAEQLIPKKDAPMPVDNRRAFAPDSTSYRIVGTEFTYKLGKGEMLTKVALRFYGTKKLWPYLVQHNRDVIKNPNSVPSGITLKIPRLEKIQQ